jgi:hypothetical protein
VLKAPHLAVAYQISMGAKAVKKKYSLEKKRWIVEMHSSSSSTCSRRRFRHLATDRQAHLRDRPPRIVATTYGRRSAS